MFSKCRAGPRPVGSLPDRARDGRACRKFLGQMSIFSLNRVIFDHILPYSKIRIKNGSRKVFKEILTETKTVKL